jgi:hypothetical protein
MLIDVALLEAQMRRAPLTGHAELATVPFTPGVYTAWLGHVEQCFYVRLTRKLAMRIASHFSGQRGGDQYCLYVYDSFDHQERCAFGGKTLHESCEYTLIARVDP